MRNDWLYTPDEYGETPLTRVAKSGRTDIARIILLTDDSTEEEDMSPLHRAAYWGLEDSVTNLLDSGADASEEDALGDTPLHKAVRHGNSETVTALLLADADPNARNRQGLTPLHWAAVTGRREIAEILLSHGANAYVTDWVTGGMTPHEFAKHLGYKELASVLENHMRVI